MLFAAHPYFVYRQIMNVDGSLDLAISGIASAIGEPARARMLCSLLDGHARTSTELAVVAAVTPSTASVHLNRLRSQNLVSLHVQGRHRYYRLAGPAVAGALERLSVLAGAKRSAFVPSTPGNLRSARTCYDHMAGAIAVTLHDHFLASRWLRPARGSNAPARASNAYDLTPSGADALASLGLDLDAARGLRRRFAYACLDWSERRPHLGGALGAALLDLACSKRWVMREYDSRALSITRLGRREIESRFGLQV